MTRTLRAFALLLAAVLAPAAGCGDAAGRGTVSGKITVGGRPLPKGLITFLSETGNRDSFNASIVDGEYSLANVPVGPARVIVIPALESPGGGGPPAGGGDVSPVRVRAANTRRVEVPDKYQNPETSGLHLTIQKGSNTFDADLVP